MKTIFLVYENKYDYRYYKNFNEIKHIGTYHLRIMSSITEIIKKRKEEEDEFKKYNWKTRFNCEGWMVRFDFNKIEWASISDMRKKFNMSRLEEDYMNEQEAIQVLKNLNYTMKKKGSYDIHPNIFLTRRKSKPNIVSVRTTKKVLDNKRQYTEDTEIVMINVHDLKWKKFETAIKLWRNE